MGTAVRRVEMGLGPRGQGAWLGGGLAAEAQRWKVQSCPALA